MFQPNYKVQVHNHFVRTSLNQTFESLSGASLAIGLPNRANYQTAGIHFIVSNQGADFGNDDAKNNDFSDPTGETCKNLGYTVTSCASGMFNKACPYNDKIYDRCCDATYKYTSSTCVSPKKLSSDTCGGKYRCYCDTATYPYATCNSPQIKGNSCTDDTGTRYATCTCPSGVATPYGCETYYASPCNSVCQKAYADNCRNRTSVQTPYGCETYFSDCKSKCQKAYADNCRNRTAVSALYGCKQAFGDCQSKCEIAYSDNCHNRTAVISSCPSNATCSYFSDCSSKIQSWSCNSGYEKSGNACVASIKVGSIVYGDGSVSEAVVVTKTPVGVVFDVQNRLAVALEDTYFDDHDKYMGAGTYAGKTCVSTAVKCTNKEELLSCGVDGQANTSAALVALCTRDYDQNRAPLAVHSYVPSGCGATFCQKTKWFIPSARDLINIYNSKDVINKTINILNGNTLGGDYWSSTEYDNIKVWRVVISSYTMNHPSYKYSSSERLRPVVKF